MQSISIVLAAEVSEDHLRQFVVQIGGRWDSLADLAQGVIEEGDAIVYLTAEPVDVEPEELVDVRKRLGGMPRSMIVVRVGRATGSDALARSVVDRLRDQWMGWVLPE